MKITDERIRAISAELREKGAALMPDVTELIDYSEGVGDLPKADVLKYRFTDGSWMAVRPSGTEPKIKLYVNAVSDDPEKTQALLNAYSDAAVKLLESF